MNLFRSGEHVALWLGDRPAGVSLPVATLASLAQDWWGDRLAPQWRPHSRAQNQAIIDALGLVGPFWQLG